MRPRSRLIMAALVAACLLPAMADVQARPSVLGTAFMYQGSLKQGGAPYTGVAEFQFRLYDAAFAGNQIGGQIAMLRGNAPTVSNGLFSVSLDFGATAFGSEGRWLEVDVRTGLGAFTTLSPRQPVSAVPFALQTRGIATDAAGNVGIGTNVPASRLHIKGADEGIRIDGTGVGAPNSAFMTFSDSAGTSIGYVGDGSSSNTSVYLGAYSGDTALVTAAGQVLTAKAGGNVGIGTAVPNEKLTIAGSMEIGTSAGDYQHVRIGGGNSSGFLYGSFPGFGDGIHMGYNFYKDAGGTGHTINSGGGTSRITMGYGSIELAASATGFGAPSTVLRVVSSSSGENVQIGSTNFFDKLSVFDANFNPLVVGRASNGSLVRFIGNALEQGNISVSGATVSYNGFTGSHFAWIDSTQPIERGALVKMTGNNHRLHKNAGSDVVYGIEMNASANESACLGAYLDVLEPNKAIDADNPRLVMAVGNGDLWVVDSGLGDIQPGDYLISSDVPGCAMKDDPRRFPIGHIVARAAERVNWSAADRDEQGVARRKISVFFENFVRGSDAAVNDMQIRLARLESLLDAKDRELLAANHAISGGNP